MPWTDEYRKAYLAKWRAEHREQAYPSTKEWRLKNPEKAKALRVKEVFAVRKRKREIKNSIFDILGHVCTLCDFSDERALQIDHINDDGCFHRKSVYPYQYLQSILEDPDIKQKYQILCANCNWIKEMERRESKYPEECL